MPQSLAQNAIALLIDLAERGEVDPWDVQVIDVIDRFLQELGTSSKAYTNRDSYETDLSESGQAFLYASMLVLLKADSLARADAPEAEPDALAEGEFLEAEDLELIQMPLHLDRKLRRRAVAQPPQQRRVTLQELIDQLRLMAAAMEDTSPRPRARRPRPQAKSQAVRAIAQLAHQENLSEVALELDQFLATQWHAINQGQDWLEFDYLLELWAMVNQHRLTNAHHAYAEGHSPEEVRLRQQVGERVGVFWALLFLSAQSKVELAQEEFYQDLKVRTLSEVTAYALPD